MCVVLRYLKSTENYCDAKPACHIPNPCTNRYYLKLDDIFIGGFDENEVQLVYQGQIIVHLFEQTI